MIRKVRNVWTPHLFAIRQLSTEMSMSSLCGELCIRELNPVWIRKSKDLWEMEVKCTEVILGVNWKYISIVIINVYLDNEEKISSTLSNLHNSFRIDLRKIMVSTQMRRKWLIHDETALAYLRNPTQNHYPWKCIITFVDIFTF